MGKRSKMPKRNCARCGRVFQPTRNLDPNNPRLHAHCSSRCSALSRSKDVGWHTHRMSRTPTHYCWMAMKQRCTNPKNPEYVDYGARGIIVCERWLNSFDNFLADMGKKPNGLTIERIDNNGNYCPENCRWATPAEQVRNTRRNVMITHAGRTMCLMDWAREASLPVNTLKHRIVVRGWPVETALTTPSQRTKLGGLHG